jgi:hypothetical protein
LLCVFLTLIAATAQVCHVHSGSSNSVDRDCSLCSVAHSSAIVAAAIQSIPTFDQLRTFTIRIDSHFHPPAWNRK